jgi:capsular polysaccharide biosynthesis protein
LLAAAAVLILRSASIPLYTATASAAIVRTQSDINLDERFTTSSNATGQGDAAARRATLLGLVSSTRIAETVIADLGDLLTLDERNPAALLDMVSGSMAPVSGRNIQSDLIDISATAESPEKATAIANAWARAYVQEVNRIYGQVPDEMMTSVDAELARAAVAYDRAQADLEGFLATSPLSALTRQVAEQENTVAQLREIRNRALQTYVDQVVTSYERIVAAFLKAQTDGQLLALEKEQEGRLARLGAFLDAYNMGQSENLTAQTDRDRALFRQLYDQWLRTNGYLAAARTLQEQLVAGGASAVATTAQALQLLKLQAVAGAGERPVTMGDLYGQGQDRTTAQSLPAAPDMPSAATIQLQVEEAGRAPGVSPAPLFQLQLDGTPETTEAGLGQDIDGTIAALATELAALEQQIAELDAALSAGQRLTETVSAPAAATALLETFQTEYPLLFAPGPLAELSSRIALSSTMPIAAQEQANALLESADERLPSAGPGAPMQAVIDQVEGDIRRLLAQLEAETARNRQFSEQRDLAWDAYSTLNSKQAELRLARAAANTEVRFGYPAVPPLEPQEGPSLILTVGLALVVGLLVGIVLAFVLEYLGRPPLGSRTSSTA